MLPARERLTPHKNWLSTDHTYQCKRLKQSNCQKKPQENYLCHFDIHFLRNDKALIVRGKTDTLDYQNFKKFYEKASLRKRISKAQPRRKHSESTSLTILWARSTHSTPQTPIRTDEQLATDHTWVRVNGQRAHGKRAQQCYSSDKTWEKAEVKSNHIHAHWPTPRGQTTPDANEGEEPRDLSLTRECQESNPPAVSQDV